MFMKKFWKSNQKAIKFIIEVFFVWQAVIFLISFFASRQFPARERFMYNDGKEIVNPIFLWDRANFDGIHYLLISRGGYGLYQQAFFPLYPKLIQSLRPVFGGKDLLAAVFVSNISLFAYLILLYKLACLDYSESIAQKTIIFFLVFPTSFFGGMVYTEALFLMLLLGSFYAARKDKWLVAGILGGLASYTRLIGVFIFPALVWEWWQGRRMRGEKWEVEKLAETLLVPLGLLVYMKFLWRKWNDPLMFIHVQPLFGAERSNNIILIYQVFWRYFKMILTTKLDPLYFAVWLELLSAVSFIVLLFLAFKKGMRISYLIFAAFSFFIPALTGTFSSLPRYVLVMFPCFILMGVIKDKIVCKILWISFSLLFIISSIFFFRGYWIA